MLRAPRKAIGKIEDYVAVGVVVEASGFIGFFAVRSGIRNYD